MLGVLKGKSLARILPFLLCPCLLCDSSSQLQKAQDLLAKGSLSEAVTVLRQIVQDDPGNLDAHLSLGTVLALQGLRRSITQGDRGRNQFVSQLGQSAEPIRGDFEPFPRDRRGSQSLRRCALSLSKEV